MTRDFFDELRRAGEVPPPPDREGAFLRAMAAVGITKTARRRAPRRWVMVAAAVLMLLPGTPLALRGVRGLVHDDRPVAETTIAIDEDEPTIDLKGPAIIDPSLRPIAPTAERTEAGGPRDDGDQRPDHRPDVLPPTTPTQPFVDVSFERPNPSARRGADPCSADAAGNSTQCRVDPCTPDGDGNSEECRTARPIDPCLPDRNGNSREGLPDRNGNSQLCSIDRGPTRSRQPLDA